MEKPPNSEHQGIYSYLRGHYRVGGRHALILRGSKRRSGPQSCLGWKAIALTGRNDLSKALEAPDSSEWGKFGMGREPLIFLRWCLGIFMIARTVMRVGQRRERRPTLEMSQLGLRRKHITPETLYASYLASLSCVELPVIISRQSTNNMSGER